jgi:hypothetical protein
MGDPGQVAAKRLGESLMNTDRLRSSEGSEPADRRNALRDTLSGGGNGIRRAVVGQRKRSRQIDLAVKATLNRVTGCPNQKVIEACPKGGGWEISNNSIFKARDVAGSYLFTNF